jgi:penicillin amidase
MLKASWWHKTDFGRWRELEGRPGANLLSFLDDALPIDKFFRRLGIRKLSEESYELLPEDEKEFLQAYADGINDYVAGVELMGDNPTARLLPPEFLTFGISKETWRPWSPVDSLAVFRLLSFHLSWNWMNDLMRESFR